MTRAIVTVLGKDRVGIMSFACTLLAQHNINILDISQTILQDYFTMVMLVDATGCDLPFAELATLLENQGKTRDLAIHIQREDLFNAMHRI
ncbi:MAG: ACT domain-containing protein [Intestinimonas sp.]|nr:ACT domain-containing protein [Intestinimonas sp.]